MTYILVFLNFFLIIFVKQCLSNNSDVFVLTEEEYYQMPDLFALDNYLKCLSQKDGVFCVGTFELTAQKPNHIYDLMQKYSENSFQNFNHTMIHRGTCLGPRSHCPLRSNQTWRETFEACVDKNMQEEYGLRAKMIEFNSCKSKDDRKQFDSYDWAFFYYVVTLLSLNVAGTVYDLFIRDGLDGNRFLLCFSLKANWGRFTGGAPSDKRYQKLKCFNGLRGILTFLVHCAHVPIYMIQFTATPRNVEMMRASPEFATFTNGTVAIQAFLVMSVFLRCYKTWIDSEKKQPGFMTVIVAGLDRFFRISPLFMTAVGFSATLAAYTNDGPLWKKYVEDEAEVCRKTFWRQFFLMQHWYSPACVPQAWYLSVDFQLYIICTALTVYLIRRGKSVLRPMLWILASSLVVLFCIVYALELKPCLQSMTPDYFHAGWIALMDWCTLPFVHRTLYTVFRDDKSFRLLYQSVWGNFPGAFMGAIAAYVYYTAQQKNIDLKQYRWFVFIFRMAFPTTVLYCVMGYFLAEKMTSRLSVSIYATLDKPVYAAVVVFFIMGCMYEINHITRRAVEWRGWAAVSRMSLASLLFHTTLAMNANATKLFPPTFTRMNFAFEWFAMSIATFLLALPLCLIVEYPFLTLYKTFTEPKLLKNSENNDNIDSGKEALNGQAKIKVN